MSERRNRWLKPIIGVVVTVAVLGGLAELALRLILPSVISYAVRDRLDLGSGQRVEVQLGGSALWYAITGRVGQLTVEVPELAAVEGVTADVVLRADSVPFDFMHGDIVGARAEITVDGSHLGPAVHLLTRGVADSGEVVAGELEAVRDVQLLGVDVPLTVRLALAVDGGDLLVTPTAVGAGDLGLDADQIRGLLGGAFDGLLVAHEVCVRDQLPLGVALTGIALAADGSATVSADIAPGIVSDPAQRERGVCD